MKKEEVEGLFKLAGFVIDKMWELPNGYWRNDAEMSQENPWWLVRISLLDSRPVGTVTIGWRKRVISIDWTDTRVRGNVIEAETDQWITHADEYVHAYGPVKALEYLTVLQGMADKQLRTEPEDEFLERFVAYAQEIARRGRADRAEKKGIAWLVRQAKFQRKDDLEDQGADSPHTLTKKGVRKLFNCHLRTGGERGAECTVYVRLRSGNAQAIREAVERHKLLTDYQVLEIKDQDGVVVKEEVADVKA